MPRPEERRREPRSLTDPHAGHNPTLDKRLAPRCEAIPLTEAAKILGVCERTLKRWGKASPPHITLVRLGPRLLFVPRDEIARLRRERAL